MEQLSAGEIQSILSRLSPTAEGLYYFLPDECWMTEKTISKALKTHTRAISLAKKELEEAKLISIIREKSNYNKISEIHTIIKVKSIDLHLIPQEYAWVVRARELILSPQYENVKNYDGNRLINDKNVLTSESISNSVFSLNWGLLNKYSAAEINSMSRLEQAELYMEVGFLVLPTNYPIFSPSGRVSCSCKRGAECHAIGKHPAVKRFKELTPESYQKKRKAYLQRFKNNPDLNIGFKVFGFSVVDVDYDKGGGISLALLREEFPGLDETLAVAASNGEHLYSSTVGLNQSVSSLGRGLDIRSDRTTGFIVAPCSTHRSGKQYQWKSISDLQPIPVEWFSNETEPRRERRKGIKTGRSIEHIKIPHQLSSDYVIPEGERNNTLFKFAARFRGRGANESQLYDELVALRDTFCEKSENPEDEITNEELRKLAEHVASNYPTNAEKLRANAA